MPAVKIASGEITNLQLLESVGSFGKPIIMSTGMATMEELEQAVNILRNSGAHDIALLQCVSVYPTSFEDANVTAMNTLGESFGTVAGYSDNGSAGMLVPLMAVALGASVIEKHVTSKKERGSIDDIFSLSVDEFADMVRRIREIEKRENKTIVLDELKKEFGPDFDLALGDGIKRLAMHGTEKKHPGIEGTFIQREADERRWARRGVYLTRPIQKGTQIEKEMLTLLRPDIGISGVEYGDIIGKIAGEDLEKLHPLKVENDKILLFHRADIIPLYAEKDPTFARALEESASFE